MVSVTAIDAESRSGGGGTSPGSDLVCYVHFHTNTPGKGMNPFIITVYPAYGLNSSICW